MTGWKLPGLLCAWALLLQLQQIFNQRLFCTHHELVFAFDLQPCWLPTTVADLPMSNSGGNVTHH